MCELSRTFRYRSFAKFKAEFSDHFEKEAVLFYYLFTELFLMVDSRAKNMFPSFMGGSKWFSLPYDFDTAIGINNEGALVFSYNLEDIDHTEGGADVYNGQQSVLWVNVRAAFFEDIKAMYQSLRSKGALSYADIEARFEKHQAKWPEAIFNEDAWFKYLQPLVEDGSAAYLSMLQGSKAEQRKWWLYNRFRYMDSKYNAGDALTDVITLRGYAKDNITVIPYADVYTSIKYGSSLIYAPSSSLGRLGAEKIEFRDIQKLNGSAFYNTTALKHVIFRGNHMCELENRTGLSANVKFYVKRSLLDIYKADSEWSNLADRIFAIEDNLDICG